MPVVESGRSAVDILHLLDLLEEEVAGARKMPVGGGVLVDRKHMLDLIDQLRVAIPANIRQARDVLQRREQALADAEQEAKRIIDSAQREVERRCSETAIVRQSEEYAHQIAQTSDERAKQLLREAEARAVARVAEAAEQARVQQDEADRYALAILTRLDTQISTFLTSIRQGIQSLQDTHEAPPDRKQT
jgi:cell division septum initiation protein DivIVA